MKSEDLGLPIEYQKYPEYFDIPDNLNHANKKNHVIEHLLRKYNVKSVLDMTCGTGSQVFHLLKKGYQVTGSDFSPGLIDIAKDKALKNNIKATFLNGDMRNLQLNEFDAIITIDNAIGHLIKKDFDIALKNINKNIKPGGIYIFDILDLDSLTEEVVTADSNKMSHTSITSDGTILSNLRTSTIDRKNGILSSEEFITIKKNDEQKKIKNKSSLQVYKRKELKNMLEQNGFRALEQQKIDTYTFEKNNTGYGILNIAQKIG